jgi:hypothetical protein
MGARRVCHGHLLHILYTVIMGARRVCHGHLSHILYTVPDPGHNGCETFVSWSAITYTLYCNTSAASDSEQNRSEVGIHSIDACFFKLHLQLLQIRDIFSENLIQ